MIFSDGNLTALRSNVFVALGSNLDNPVWQVQRAMREIDELNATSLLKISSLYETAPVGFTDQPPFVNAVVQISTTLSPHDLLVRLQEIEVQHRRLRNNAGETRNGPRTLDLDILAFDDLRFSDVGLTIPHPRMQARAFVLVPLVEIAPDFVVPGKGAARQLLAAIDCAGVALLQPAES